jgi:hypothetical protein
MNPRVMAFCALAVLVALHTPAANDRKEPWVRHVKGKRIKLWLDGSFASGDGFLDEQLSAVCGREPIRRHPAAS